MESDLEKRFQYLLEQKQKGLLQDKQVGAEREVIAEEIEADKVPNTRRRRFARELGWFLGALLLAYGLAWLIREFMIDRILEERFVIHRDWKAPPDESTIDLVINQEFWRTYGFIHLYAAVCLIGCYLSRACFWFMKTQLPSLLGVENQVT